MKKIILLISTITVFAVSGICQINNPAVNDNKVFIGNLYSIKAKKQNTAGWVMLGGGAIVTAIGVAIFPKDYDIFGFGNSSGTESQASLATAFTIAGTLSMLGSIPVFIAAGKNRRRAELALSNQKISFQLPGKMSQHISGISLSIPIGK